MASLLLFTLSLLSLLSFSTPAKRLEVFLDVSDAILGTVHAVRPDLAPQQDPQSEQLTQVSPSSLSVKIHPRLALTRPGQHPDYASLTESRLARDSLRVNSLLTKHSLALRNLTPADLEPKPSSTIYGYGESALAAPVTSGTSQGSGEYFSRVGVGSPPKPYSMVIDTGSDISWLQCQPCSDCYTQTDPIYRPSLSSTFSPIPCSSTLCSSLDLSTCQSNKCIYQVSYGDGSYTVGEFATETLSLGSSKVPRVALGCGHDNEGLFVASAGLLGLGGGPLSLTKQLKATSFSYCLVNRDSRTSSTLDFNSPAPRGSVSTKILPGRVNTFYYIALTGLSVGGRPLSIPTSLFSTAQSTGAGVIVDSGTAITRLPTQAYNSLRDAFSRLTQHMPSAGSVALFDTCYDLSSMTSVRVPTVALNFAGGGSLQLPAKNYLIPVDSSGTFCFAFAPTSSAMTIIGNVQQQGIRVHYDLARSTASFAPNNC